MEDPELIKLHIDKMEIQDKMEDLVKMDVFQCSNWWHDPNKGFGGKSPEEVLKEDPSKFDDMLFVPNTGMPQ